MVDALTKSGIPVGYLLFAGEQHGFRKAENIKRALDAELYFYSELVLPRRPVVLTRNKPVAAGGERHSSPRLD